MLWLVVGMLCNFFNFDWVGMMVDLIRLVGILQVQVEGYGFLCFYVNSLFVIFVVMVVSLLVVLLVVFVLIKWLFFGSCWLFCVLLLLMMLFWEVIIVFNFVMVVQLGWINSYVVLMVLGLVKVFVVFYFCQVMLGVFDELVNVVMLDGVGMLCIWWSVVLFLLRFVLVVIVILVVVGEWNNFLWLLFVVNDVVMLILFLQFGKMVGDLSFNLQLVVVLMVGLLFVLLLVVVFFLLFQCQFVVGLVVGVIKG